MVCLKNIQITATTAEADFYPETSKTAGHIVINLENREIISCEDVPGYGESYQGHAKWRLIRMAKENDRRSECLVMWY